MPSSGLGAFQSGRLFVWFETLGYSNCFCQFVGPGWFAALLGASFLVMGECLPDGRLSRRRFGLAILALLVTALLGLVAVSVPVVIASRRLERARRATALGLHDKAEGYLRSAIRVLPSLREDTFYIAQLGLLDYRRGQVTTSEGRIFFANQLEREGRYAQAAAMYSALLAEEPEGSAVRREASRSILRDGAYAFNAGRTEDAIRRFELVLREEPCNLKANYALQLAYLRTGRRAEVEDMVRRIEATYAHFHALTKAIVLAQSRENAMFATLKDGEMDATFRHAVEAKKQ
jgi:tetratricopeptide (TPR) repeat protein